ncbi:MAG: undecaprenyl-diphosphatase UppP [Thermoflexales bacterium]|nr:undecaprenyl-diphosphatase UppP [Thermoflexales bacterium]
MSIFQAIILGLVQGLTEYIPVSSSAHLVLVPWLLGWTFTPKTAFVFDVLVQWGTLVGVLIYFWRDIWAIVRGVITGLIQRKPFGTFEARLGWFVVLATIPAVVVGLVLKDFFEQIFSDPKAVAALLFLTAAILIAAERLGQRQRRLESITASDAMSIGVWQALSILPGVSRSGSTIAGGMLRGLDRPAAARFSFLMSIPALLGAGVLAIKDLVDTPNLADTLGLPIVVGFVAAAISGYLCIRWLLGFLQKHSLTAFAAYCAAFGALCLIVGLVRG